MNPFLRLARIPADSKGERGFTAASDAQAHGQQHAGQPYFVLKAGQEYAWVTAPAVEARMVPALARGIEIVAHCKV